MGDVARTTPDHSCLFAVAAGQHGYVTAALARACGFARDALTYHTRQGRFFRLRRGLYRLRDYPSSPPGSPSVRISPSSRTRAPSICSAYAM